MLISLAWHEASEELPNDFGEYLVRLVTGLHAVDEYDPVQCKWEIYSKDEVIYWMEIPPV